MLVYRREIQIRLFVSYDGAVFGVINCCMICLTPLVEIVNCLLADIFLFYSSEVNDVARLDIYVEGARVSALKLASSFNVVHYK